MGTAVDQRNQNDQFARVEDPIWSVRVSDFKKWAKIISISVITQSKIYSNFMRSNEAFRKFTMC